MNYTNKRYNRNESNFNRENKIKYKTQKLIGSDKTKDARRLNPSSLEW